MRQAGKPFMHTGDVLSIIWRRLTALIACEGVRFVGGWWLASRLWLVVATIVAARLSYPSILSQPAIDPLWRTWDRWDVKHYLLIAHEGYQPSAVGTTPAFFPLWPLVMRSGSLFTGGDDYLAGLILANVAWLVALFVLYRLVEHDFDGMTARWSVIALSCFPATLFSFVPYPESLFLALAIMAMWRMRLGDCRWAGVLGGLAALTRQAGVILIVPFLWEWWRQRKGVGWDWLWGGMIPAGVAAYALWLWRAVGDPLAFVHAQATWGRRSAWPWQALTAGWNALWVQPSRYFALRAWQEWLTVIAMGLILGWAIVREIGRNQSSKAIIPTSYLVFAGPLWLLFLTQPDSAWPMLSQSRFALELFPLFTIIGGFLARRPLFGKLWIVIGILAQMLGLGIFARAGWMI